MRAGKAEVSDDSAVGTFIKALLRKLEVGRVPIMRLLELSCRSGDKLLVNATTSCDAEEVFETRVDWQVETVVEATGRAIEGVVAVEGVPINVDFYFSCNGWSRPLVRG